MQKTAKYILAITQIEKDKQENIKVEKALRLKITLLQTFKRLLSTKDREKFIIMFEKAYSKDHELITFFKKFNTQKNNGVELHQELDKWIKEMVLMADRIKIKL